MNLLTRLGLLLILIGGALFSIGCGEEAEKSPGEVPSSKESRQETTKEVVSVRIYLLKGESLFPVDRESDKKDPASAIAKLLEGPTEEEREEGLTTAIPDGTKLNSYSVENGVARLDFSSRLLEYGGGSAMVESITNQIMKTVIDNGSGIEEVKITVDGVPSQEALQP
ncbi:MAG: GerMN domain-containing protein [Actinomycetota bacterium]|nr:GerMN domain-containing protein [Actinomycetota bacterium]